MNTRKLQPISCAIAAILACATLTACKSTKEKEAEKEAAAMKATTTSMEKSAAATPTTQTIAAAPTTTTSADKGATTTTIVTTTGSGTSATTSTDKGAAAGTTGTTTGSGTNTQKAQFLFVQTAKDVSFNNGSMTLRGVDPTTVCFSDRPERIAGHMPTANMVPFWGEGKNSFTADPPNATLSVMDGQSKSVSNLVVVLSNPRLNGEELTYDIKTLEGTPPTKGGPCSLFIDIIGMPLTPYSYAGAARRADRRGYAYPGAYGPAVAVYPRPVAVY